jgi:Tfp pilus assembly protein PilF
MHAGVVPDGLTSRRTTGVVMMDDQIAEWLYDGVMALLNGDKDTARDLLLQVVDADERNEEAWLWLSGAVDDPEDQQVALENALDINPNSEPARQGLAWLAEQQG